MPCKVNAEHGYRCCGPICKSVLTSAEYPWYGFRSRAGHETVGRLLFCAGTIGNADLMSTSTAQKITQLRYEDRDGMVVVTPEDEDRFAITVEAAIQACQVFREQALFRLQFKQTLQKVAEWLNDHADDVAQAYLTVRDAGLLFLVARKSNRYDQHFEDDLTELDIQIAQDQELNLIRLSVLAIPDASEDSVASFLAPGKTLSLSTCPAKPPT